MFFDKKVIVVMPAYNAENTLRITYDEVMGQKIVDTIILVDDGSSDLTVKIARTLPNLFVYEHIENKGYGGNQKSCYKLALEFDADIIIMVHPDYQYTPKLIPSMVALIANGLYHCVLGSRILGGYALKGGMPWWKYIANRVLTVIENLFIGAKLSEYHTGYRAFSKELLQKIPWTANSDDFVFDNQMLAQIIWYGYTIGEITCPTKYFEDASSINFIHSVRYGLGCLKTTIEFTLCKAGIIKNNRFPNN